MTDSPEVMALRLEAEHRRARLLGTAHQLQERLSPRALANNAWKGTKEKGADLAENAVDAVKARPLAATGLVAAITMFLAREPLMDLAGRVAENFGPKRKTRRAAKPKPRQSVTEKA